MPDWEDSLWLLIAVKSIRKDRLFFTETNVKSLDDESLLDWEGQELQNTYFGNFDTVPVSA